MSHEIYYTSASEGIRPGQQGFCTVGASDGIPRPLMERLESLSGYRHQFESSSGGPANPVAHAHWIVRLGGKSHHVLSRICDSGFDYTKRNNSFAHHLVVEGDELAPAGPAWMLARPGTMEQAWDGHVGPIVRTSRLPRGDASPARCVAWEQAAGDAGWAGLLAENFSKSPGKPVCILYAPGQEILPLIDEAIRLLPVNLRWEVTFNTYFTSVSASAVCAWRCCLANTHAAEAAVRHAASGIVIDLTNIRQAGTLPDSPWIEMARTGQPMKSAAMAFKPSSRSPARFWPSAKDQPTIPLAPPEIEDAPVPSEAEADENIIDMPLGPLPPMRSMRSKVRVVKDSQPTRIRPGSRGAVARPWRRVALLYVAACMAIGAGTWFVIRAARELGPPDTPPRRIGPTTSRADMDSTAGTTGTTIPRVALTTAPTTLAAPATQQATVVAAVTRPAPEPVATPAVKTIILQSPLEHPVGGAGLSDQIQRISLPPTSDDLQAVTSLGILFPGDKPTYICRDAGLSGTLAAVPAGAADHPGFVLRWSDAIGTTTPADLLTVQFDKTLRQIELTWRTSVVLRRPEVAGLTYWLVRTSPMTVSEPGKPAPRRIAFAPLEIPPFDLSKESGEITLPQDFPASVQMEVRDLPAHWSAKTRLHWEAADSDVRRPENAWHIIQLERLDSGKPTGIVATLKIRPGFKGIDCDYAAKVQAYRDGIVRLGQEVTTIDVEINRLVVDAESDIKQNDRELADVPKALKAANKERRALLAEARKPLDARKGEREQLMHGYRMALSWYADLASFNIVVRLSEDAPLVVLRVRKM